MKPSPTKLAVLISLMGLGLPWPEIALGESGGAAASIPVGTTSNDAAVRSALSLLEAPKPQVKLARTVKKSATHTKRAPETPMRTRLDMVAWDKAALGLEAGVDPDSGRAIVGRQIDTRRPVKEDQLAMIKVALGLGSYRPPATGGDLLEQRPRQLEVQAPQSKIAVADVVPSVADISPRPTYDGNSPVSESSDSRPVLPGSSLFDSNGALDKPLRNKDESPPMLADEPRGVAGGNERWSAPLALVTTFPVEDDRAVFDLASALRDPSRSADPDTNASTPASRFEISADDLKPDAGPVFFGATEVGRDAQPPLPATGSTSASVEPASRISSNVQVRAPEKRRLQSMGVPVVGEIEPNDPVTQPTPHLSEELVLVAGDSPESPIAPRLAPGPDTSQTSNAVSNSKNILFERDYYASRQFLAPDAILNAFRRDLGASDMLRDVDPRRKQERASRQESFAQQSTEVRDDLFAIEQERDIARILSEREIDRTVDSIEFAAGAAERLPSADVPMVVRLIEKQHVPADEAPSKSPVTLTAIDINLDELDKLQYPLLPRSPSVASEDLRREIPNVSQSGLSTVYVNLDDLDGFEYPLLSPLARVATPTINQMTLTELDIDLDYLEGFHYPLLPRLAPLASAELLGEIAKIGRFNALSSTKIDSKRRQAEIQSGANERDELPTASAWASAMWRAVEPAIAMSRGPSEAPTYVESANRMDRQCLARPLGQTEESATEAALKIGTYLEKESNIVRATAKLAVNPVTKAEPVRALDEWPQTPHEMSPRTNEQDKSEAADITQATLATVLGVTLDHTAKTDAMGSNSIAESNEPRTISLGGDLLALADSKLDQMRGGFETDSGLKISFGIERAVYINGSLVTTTSFNVSDLSKLTAGQAQAAGLNGASLAMVQNGPGNTFTLGQISASNIGTVIQNTLNDQKIQGVTIINATVNSLGLIRSADLQSTIRNGLTDSLRR